MNRSRPTLSSPSLEYIINTEFGNEIHELIWKLPGFDILKPEQLITTNAYQIRNPDRLDLFRVKLERTGTSSVNIHCTCLVKRRFRCKVTCSENIRKESLILSELEYCTTEEGIWNFLTEVHMPLPGIQMKSLCHTFIFKFTVLDDLDKQITSLNRDLEDLLINELFTDMVIKALDGEEFKVHKGVLACRSAVLRASFEHDTIESHTNVVESPFESEVLREVLTYIYTDTSAAASRMPEKLLPAADYYQLHKLKQLCEEALPRQLTVNNAIDILELADSYFAKELKLTTLKFIKMNAKLVLKTEGWANLISKPHLLKSTSEYIIENKN